MTEKEITQTAQKYGYRLLNGDAESYDGYYGYWYIKEESNPRTLFFEVSKERGLVSRSIHFNEKLEKGMGIKELVENHKDRFLSLSAIDLEVNILEPTVDSYREIRFYKDDENLSGNISINIKEGIASLHYQLYKKQPHYTN